MRPRADEISCVPPSIPHSSLDVPSSNQEADPAQIPPPNTAMAMDMDIQALIEGFSNSVDGFGSIPLPPLKLDQMVMSEINCSSAPADAPEDGCLLSKAADMLGVAAVRTEIQNLEHEEPEGWDLFMKESDQSIHADPSSTVSDDAGMPEVNAAAAAAATQQGSLPVAVGGGEANSTSNHVPVEAQRSWFDLFKMSVEQDLSQWSSRWREIVEKFSEDLKLYRNGALGERYPIGTDSWCSKVRFTGPDPKGKKPQGRWKETSMKGLRAVADPSTQPPGQKQQQRYVGLKKTLELDDERAHEYTPLLPADDGSNKLVPAEFSLRFEFKEDKPESSSTSTKRSISGDPKDGPKVPPPPSDVWDHMTRLHVKVTPKDGSTRKKPYYKVMYAICHHCDQAFNADSGHGTHNLSTHLGSCKNCTCTHSHAH